jgi:hypothetical protein
MLVRKSGEERTAVRMETGIILIYGVDSVNNHNLDSENKTEHDK